MTDSMVERVARAIEDAEVGYEIKLTRLVDGESTYTLTYPDGSADLTFGSHREALDHVYRRLLSSRARAAIEAMRKPTSAMLNAGACVKHSQACDGGYEHVGRSVAGAAWPAMIDAALKEGQA